MVNASKILTVSYGTFSCTLEGFDEPFSTMRSIAEYFRDLAADDRYFGAEPPTPDAEMLHKIAEREIQRRVEAKVEDNGVVLRQVEDQSATPVAAEAPTEVVAEAAQSPAAVAPAPVAPATPPVAPVQESAEIDIPEPEIDEVADSVAAKLARIRAAVARSREEPEPLLNSVFAEDEHAEPLFDDESIDSAFQASDDSEADDSVAEEPEDTEAADDLAQAPAEDTSAEGTVAEDVSGEVVLEDDVVLEDEVVPEDEAEDLIEDLAAEAQDETDDVTDIVVKETIETDEALAEVSPEVAEDPSEIVDSADYSVTPIIAADSDFAEAEADADDTAEDDLDLSSLSESFAENAVIEEEEAAIAKDVVSEDDDISETDAEEVAEIALDLSDDSDEAVGETPAEQADPEADETAEADETDFSAMLDAAIAESSDDESEEEALYDDAVLDLSNVLASTDDEASEAEDKAEAQPEVDFAAWASDAEHETEETAAQDDADADLSKLLLTDDDRSEAEDDKVEDVSPAAPHVRVMKMTRADFDAEFAQPSDDDDDTGAEPSDEQVETPDVSEADDTGLSAEEEADLINELADLQRDEQDEAGEDGTLESTEDADSVSGALEALSADSPDASSNLQADDASVDRLLARADTALEDQEGNRRRSAIAHLKAAVAAVRADGDQVKDDAEAKTARTMGQFRDDLARAVRPDSAKPTAVEPTHTADVPVEPKAERPRRKMPPLMLVSEQRVDKAETEDMANPVHPRRIHADDLDKELENELFDDGADKGETQAAGNLFTESDDFKGFVAEVGAEGTQEVLEASLAFGLYVEGASHNSRPQIMRRMLNLFDDGSVSREDGLRAFGVLLREGQIHRVTRGQFLLSETSRFFQSEPPEAHAAG